MDRCLENIYESREIEVHSISAGHQGRAGPNSVDTKDIGEFLRLMPVQIYVNIAMDVSKSSLRRRELLPLFKTSSICLIFS